MNKKRLVIILGIIIKANIFAQSIAIPINSIKFNEKVIFNNSQILDNGLSIKPCDSMGNLVIKSEYYLINYSNFYLIYDTRQFTDSLVVGSDLILKNGKYFPDIEFVNIKLKLLKIIKIKLRKVIQLNVVYGPFMSTQVIKRNFKFVRILGYNSKKEKFLLK